MKAEDRILELLAEYLQKTDRLLDRMERTDKNVEIMSKAILEHSLKFNQVNQQIFHIYEDIKHLRDDQGIMLKELLSISKRVSSLEEKS